MVALRTIRHERYGTHLNGVFDPVLETLLEPGLLRYVRHQVAYGARTRHEGPWARLPEKPHPSAVGYMEEFLQKVWKDA